MALNHYPLAQPPQIQIPFYNNNPLPAIYAPSPFAVPVVTIPQLPSIPPPPNQPLCSKYAQFYTEEGIKDYVYMRQENKAHTPAEWRRFARRFSGCGANDLWLAVENMSMQQWVFFSDPIHVWRIMALYKQLDHPPHTCPPLGQEPHPRRPPPTTNGDHIPPLDLSIVSSSAPTLVYSSTPTPTPTTAANLNLDPNRFVPPQVNNNFSAFRGLSVRHPKWDEFDQATSFGPAVPELEVDKIRFDYDLLGIVDCFSYPPFASAIASIRWIEKSGRIDHLPIPDDYKGSSQKVGIKLHDAALYGKLSDPLDTSWKELHFDPTFVRLNHLPLDQFDSVCRWIDGHVGTIIQKIGSAEKDVSGAEIIMTAMRMSNKTEADRLIELDWKMQRSEGTGEALRKVSASRYRGLFKKDTKLGQSPFKGNSGSDTAGSGAGTPTSADAPFPPVSSYQAALPSRPLPNSGVLTPRNGFAWTPYAGSPYVAPPHNGEGGQTPQAIALADPSYTKRSQPYNNNEARLQPRKPSPGSGSGWRGPASAGASPTGGGISPVNARAGGLSPREAWDRQPNAIASSSRPAASAGQRPDRPTYASANKPYGTAGSAIIRTREEVDAEARNARDRKTLLRRGTAVPDAIGDVMVQANASTDIGVNLSKARKEKEEAYDQRVKARFSSRDITEELRPKSHGEMEMQVIRPDPDAMDVDLPAAAINLTAATTVRQNILQPNGGPQSTTAAIVLGTDSPPPPRSDPPGLPTEVPPPILVKVPPGRGGDPRIGMVRERSKVVSNVSSTNSAQGSATKATVPTRQRTDLEELATIETAMQGFSGYLENVVSESSPSRSSGELTEEEDLLNRHQWRHFSKNFASSSPNISQEQRSALDMSAGRTPFEARRHRKIALVLDKHGNSVGFSGMNHALLDVTKIEQNLTGLGGVEEALRKRGS